MDPPTTQTPETLTEVSRSLGLGLELQPIYIHFLSEESPKSMGLGQWRLGLIMATAFTLFFSTFYFGIGRRVKMPFRTPSIYRSEAILTPAPSRVLVNTRAWRSSSPKQHGLTKVKSPPENHLSQGLKTWVGRREAIGTGTTVKEAMSLFQTNVNYLKNECREDAGGKILPVNQVKSRWDDSITNVSSEYVVSQTFDCLTKDEVKLMGAEARLQ
jgi:hypothetical protein